MHHHSYLMESDEEILRLEMKTDSASIRRQALWAGIKPGMRVVDIGCGTGKTTSCLLELAHPGGQVVGLDISEKRVRYAETHYGSPGIEFNCMDICVPLDDLGLFDFAWVRFMLEYHREHSFSIVQNVSRLLKPGGILCLIDLDYNCMNHFGLSPRLEGAIHGIMAVIQQKRDFDPYAGRRLYSYLYDLGYEAIDVNVASHHLIFGELPQKDAFNWMKKVEIAGRKSGYPFAEYPGGYGEFCEEFKTFLTNPRRFTYTPVISCRGRKPSL
jgi:SAM-dependent methyltransferase